MRVTVKVSGKVGANVTKVELGRFGRDNMATVQFANSLAGSCVRALQIAEEKERDAGTLNEKKVEQVTKRMTEGNFALVNVDIWVEVRKGREVYFAKVWIDERNAGVGTLNVLNGLARHVWGWTLQLKTCQPPKGMEGLRGINVLKDFVDMEQEDHKCHIVNGRVVVEGDKSSDGGITQLRFTEGMRRAS